MSKQNAKVVDQKNRIVMMLTLISLIAIVAGFIYIFLEERRLNEKYLSEE